MNSLRQIPRCCLLIAFLWLGNVSVVGQVAGDRDTGDIDRYTVGVPVDNGVDPGPPIDWDAIRSPSDGIGGAGWRAYEEIWRRHVADPEGRVIRRFLGLPTRGPIPIRARPGRGAPRWLGWQSGTFKIVETPAFRILSRAEADATERVARDLQRSYWVWTQMFFPFWRASDQVEKLFAGAEEGEAIVDVLRRSKARLALPAKMQVVLFAGPDTYRALFGDNAAAQLSTGFYHDGFRTTILYADEIDHAATRRHELVHQMFREATRSGLGRNLPGENGSFWLVEGIAGYFESLHFDGPVATVGGWDAPRLQYARHRAFVSRDFVPWFDLVRHGRVEAQSRGDLPAWYTAAITHVHRLLDGAKAEDRLWLYQQLANLYRIPLPVNAPEDVAGDDETLRQFLSIDDEHLMVNPPGRRLSEICLAGCEVGSTGLAAIPGGQPLSWLDLSGANAGSRDVARLIPDASPIRQLSLERTAVDDSIGDWIVTADELAELDLSGTSIGDSTVTRLPNTCPRLETLWLTGSQITGKSIDAIANLERLQRVDVQNTTVGEADLERLRAAAPGLDINPL